MGRQNDDEPAVIASSPAKVTSALMPDENPTAIGEDGSSATIRQQAAGKGDTKTIAASSSVVRMEVNTAGMRI